MSTRAAGETANKTSVGPGQFDADIAAQVIGQIEIRAKYQGYITRQAEEVERQAGQENAVLPDDLDYAQVRGLTKEAQSKLAGQRPQTIGQASRIQGITPAAIALLLVYLKRRGVSYAQNNKTDNKTHSAPNSTQNNSQTGITA